MTYPGHYEGADPAIWGPKARVIGRIEAEKRDEIEATQKRALAKWDKDYAWIIRWASEMFPVVKTRVDGGGINYYLTITNGLNGKARLQKEYLIEGYMYSPSVGTYQYVSFDKMDRSRAKAMLAVAFQALLTYFKINRKQPHFKMRKR